MIIEPLTDREKDVLSLLAEGLTNREIAQRLTLSLETIKWYNKQIYEKLGVGRRTEAVAVAQRYGVLGDGQDADSDSARVGTLPTPLNDFVGRKEELKGIGLLLRENRLLTLTGPGGTGKTRLALAAAAHAQRAYADGAFFVDLAAVEEGDQVAATIVRALGLRDGGGRTAQEGGRSAGETLTRFLASRQLLLILDNFEHVLAAAPLVTELLANAPRLTILVTSRERLRVYGEQEYRVAPLAVPSEDMVTVEALEASDAVRLFRLRAQAVRPSFVLSEENVGPVAAICRRLEGLPLAIELAAVQLKLFTPPALLARLEDTLATLTQGARDRPARQQTLRATIDWSYGLLDEPERTLFRRLAVFQGGGTIAIIEEVCGEGLGGSLPEVALSLLDKSLLQRQEDSDGQTRLGMLETIRAYAREKLVAAGEEEGLRRDHARTFLALVEEGADELRAGPRQYVWIRRLLADYDNVRAALRWSFDNGEEEMGAAMAGALGHFWFRSGLYDDLHRWTTRALAIKDTLPPPVRARVFNTAGLMAWAVHDQEKGRYYDGQALHVYRELGDERNAAWTQVFLAGQSIGEPGGYERVGASCREGLAQMRAMGDKAGVSQALNVLGELARFDGHDDVARACYEEALAIARATGDRLREMMQLENLGYLAQRAGANAEAEALFLESLPIALELDSKFATAYSLTSLAGAYAEAQPQRAAVLIGAGERVFEELGALAHPGDQGVFEENRARVRERLGEEAYTEAVARGRAMGTGEAAGYALANDL